MSVQTPKKIHVFFNKLLYNLIRGVILIAPIGFTITTTLWLFNTVDSFLPDLIQIFLDYFTNGKIHPPYIPGLGLIIVIGLLACIGYISRFLIFNKLLILLDQYFEKAPGLKFIYTTFKY